MTYVLVRCVPSHQLHWTLVFHLQPFFHHQFPVRFLLVRTTKPLVPLSGCLLAVPFSLFRFLFSKCCIVFNSSLCVLCNTVSLFKSFLVPGILIQQCTQNHHTPLSLFLRKTKPKVAHVALKCFICGRYLNFALSTQITLITTFIITVFWHTFYVWFTHSFGFSFPRNPFPDFGGMLKMLVYSPHFYVFNTMKFALYSF